MPFGQFADVGGHLFDLRNNLCFRFRNDSLCFLDSLLTLFFELFTLGFDLFGSLGDLRFECRKLLLSGLFQLHTTRLPLLFAVEQFVDHRLVVLFDQPRHLAKSS